MHKTTTLRIPETLLKEIDRFAQEAHLERSAYLRDVIRKGFEIDKRERVLSRYDRGELSLGEACRKLRVDARGFLQILKQTNRNLNVSLEDMLESVSL